MGDIPLVSPRPKRAFGIRPAGQIPVADLSLVYLPLLSGSYPKLIVRLSSLPLPLLCS